MMLYPAMSDLLKQVPSRYMLVNVVAQRARQISNAAENLQESLQEKPVSLAIQDVAAGKVSLQSAGSDAEFQADADVNAAEEVEADADAAAEAASEASAAAEADTEQDPD